MNNNMYYEWSNLFSLILVYFFSLFVELKSGKMVIRTRIFKYSKYWVLEILGVILSSVFETLNY
jgi:hypothetical protein